jgi:hypothetical protein
MPEALVCPGCGAPGGAEDERFCAACGLPLVHADRSGIEEPVTASRERARKVRPQYTEGALVTVAGARNQAEAEMIQGILLEEGVPSMLRRTRGFDVPDFLAAGPRDVLVPESGYEQARRLLSEAELLTVEAEPGSMPGIGSPARLALGIAIAFALALALVWVLYQVAA